LFTIDTVHRHETESVDSHERTFPSPPQRPPRPGPSPSTNRTRHPDPINISITHPIDDVSC
jgi:hypothetical protein